MSFENPERHPKGWGYEDWIVNNNLYCGKILHFEKGKQCSLHYHKRKDETFYILDGSFEITLYDSLEDYKEGKKKIMHARPGDVIHIWIGRVHRMKSLESGNIIEISTKHFEDDSYRLESGDSQIPSTT